MSHFDDLSHEARELDLYAENTSELYGQFKSIIANLARKMKAGKYSSALAPKLWMYWYDAAAKRYCKEFGCDIKREFPKATRLQAAEWRAKEEHEKIKNGEYGTLDEAAKFAR